LQILKLPKSIGSWVHKTLWRTGWAKIVFAGIRSIIRSAAVSALSHRQQMFHVHFVNIKSYTSNYNNIPTAIKIKHGSTTNAVALLLFPLSGTDDIISRLIVKYMWHYSCPLAQSAAGRHITPGPDLLRIPYHPSVAKCWYGDTQRAVRSIGGLFPSHQRDDTRSIALCFSAPHKIKLLKQINISHLVLL
jgi:hypothetical protein